jgi:hypothetical protein
MKRKQQVGECCIGVIFFACVCVGALDMTTASDDPSSSSLYVMCARRFPRGVLGGVGMPHPGYAQCSGQRPEICFWAIFSIFSIFFYF